MFSSSLRDILGLQVAIWKDVLWWLSNDYSGGTQELYHEEKNTVLLYRSSTVNYGGV